MDLASGYSDGFNYGNGYTPLANNAINNNNFNYNANQNYANQAGMYNPFAQSGGFGAMTDYYSNAGAAYGRATGGFDGSAPGWADPQPQSSVFDTGAQPFNNYGNNATAESAALMLQSPAAYYAKYGGGGIGSDAGQSPAQYQNPAVDWSKYMTQTVSPQTGGISNQQANPWGTSPGYDYNNPATYGLAQSGGLGFPNNPSSQRLLGYDPRGGDGATGNPFGGATAESAALMLQNPAAYYAKYGGSGTQTPAQFGGPDTNLYGYPSSGSLGTGTGFGGYQPNTPYGQGGIGSDTSRDTLAWMLAQSSPYATAGAPSNGPYPNLGYNPAMQNSFANPAMQQYDWTKNNATLQQQMQDALKTIDGATGNQPAQPYGGQLPSFWQGVRDWTGMGAPQPTQGWQEGH